MAYMIYPSSYATKRPCDRLTACLPSTSFTLFTLLLFVLFNISIAVECMNMSDCPEIPDVIVGN